MPQLTPPPSLLIASGLRPRNPIEATTCRRAQAMRLRSDARLRVAFWMTAIEGIGMAKGGSIQMPQLTPPPSLLIASGLRPRNPIEATTCRRAQAMRLRSDARLRVAFWMTAIEGIGMAKGRLWGGLGSWFFVREWLTQRREDAKSPSMPSALRALRLCAFAWNAVPFAVSGGVWIEDPSPAQRWPFG